MSLSPDHELHAELFRSCPMLARLLLAELGVEVPAGVDKLTTIDASQALPTEARADVVIVVRGSDNQPRHAIIVEIQTCEDAAKRLSWPIYLAGLRGRLRCPTTLLVLATTEAVARWAARPIELGHPGLVLTPIVVGYADIPRITTADVAPELAVLSARAHPELDIARFAITAIDTLPEDTRKLYCELLANVLSAHDRAALEEAMNVSPTLRKYLDDFRAQWAFERGMREGVQQGREQGREQGLEQGREQGLEQGRAQLEQLRDKLRAIAVELVRVRLGPRFDAALEQAIRSLPVAALESLVDVLIPVDDPAQALLIVQRACSDQSLQR